MTLLRRRATECNFQVPDYEETGRMRFQSGMKTHHVAQIARFLIAFKGVKITFEVTMVA